MDKWIWTEVWAVRMGMGGSRMNETIKGRKEGIITDGRGKGTISVRNGNTTT